MKVVTTEEMRLMEARAGEAGVSLDALMESAGLAVARNAAQRLDGVRSKRVVVLVGPGNNGGDGMVAARYLADWGAVVTLYMSSARRRDDKFEECRERRCRVVEASEDRDCWQLGSYVSLADLVIDAMIGVGARPGLEPPILPVVEAVAQMKTRANQPLFVAVDAPTGVDADTGERAEACFPADVTLALGGRVMVVWECAVVGKHALAPDDISGIVSAWLKGAQPRCELPGKIVGAVSKSVPS